MARHGLTDEQWELIADIFPQPAATGRPPVNPRDMINAILWRLRTGSPWRDLPEEFGPWKTVYNHFDKWNSDGTLDEVKRRLLQTIVDENGIDTELWCVDGTVVLAPRSCEISGDGVKWSNEITNATLKWSAFAGCAVHDGVFCLRYTSPTYLLFPLPDREEDEQKLIEICRAHVVRFNDTRVEPIVKWKQIDFESGMDLADVSQCYGCKAVDRDGSHRKPILSNQRFCEDCRPAAVTRELVFFVVVIVVIAAGFFYLSGKTGLPRQR